MSFTLSSRGTVQYVNRRLTAFLLAPLLAVTLSACTAADRIVEQFGPRPHPAVLDLAHRAEADAGSGTATAELRAGHAEELFTEVQRLCGVDETGTTPDSCAFERGVTNTPAPTKDSGEAALAEYLQAIPRVPQESVDLLVSQAVDLAGVTTGEELPELPAPRESLTESDADTLRELADGEHAAIYALDIAQAYLDETGDAQAAALIVAAEERLAVLNQTLTSTGAVPLPAPGYDFAGDPPVDATMAVDLLNRVAADVDAAWRRAAAGTTDPAGREWLIQIAGHAAAAARLHTF